MTLPVCPDVELWSKARVMVLALSGIRKFSKDGTEAMHDIERELNWLTANYEYTPEFKEQVKRAIESDAKALLKQMRTLVRKEGA